MFQTIQFQSLFILNLPDANSGVTLKIKGDNYALKIYLTPVYLNHKFH